MFIGYCNWQAWRCQFELPSSALADLTVPSAHAFIASSGSEDRGIEVVHVQCGSPNRTTTAQNANMTRRRVVIALPASDGSSRGTSSSAAVLLPSIVAVDLVSVDAGACLHDADVATGR